MRNTMWNTITITIVKPSIADTTPTKECPTDI